MMPGMIMLWHGPVATIPTGWALCDGNNGTPDLRNRWIVCAEQDDGGVAKARVWTFLYQTMGADTHLHAFTGDGHSHDLADGDQILHVDPAGAHLHATTSNPASGDTDNATNVPPSYALCYIMKLPIT